MLKKYKNQLLVLSMLTLNISCKVSPKELQKNKNYSFTESFSDSLSFHSNWIDDSSQVSPKSYSLEDGSLKITTRKDSKDRVKVKTRKNTFGLGSYEWKIFIPQYGLNEKCSIGAFIYHYVKGEPEYEFDFEIGSGTKKDRLKLNTKLNEALVHCTSQYFPYETERFKIEVNKWYNFKLELVRGSNENYTVKWFINNVLVKTLKTEIKTSVKFSVHNSLENLDFMGDHLPQKENYVLFDNFMFKEFK